MRRRGQGAVASAANPRSGTSPAQSSDFQPRTAWLLLAAFALIVTAIRLHRMDLPLERDEGEYAYGAQLILDASFSYDAIHTIKLPGVHAIAALFLSVFGDPAQGLRVALLVANLASMALVFVLAARLFDRRTAVASAAGFGFLALSSGVLGLYAHVEHFVVPFALGGTILAHDSFAREASVSRSLLRWGASGLLFGCGFLVKQPGFSFALLGPALLVVGAFRSGRRDVSGALVRGGVFVAGLVLPWAAVAAWFASSGTFESFWFWTVLYARAYASEMPISAVASRIAAQAGRVVPSASFLWVLAVVGLATSLSSRSRRVGGLFALALAVLGFLGTSAGLYFREHYFVLCLAPVAVFAGAGVVAAARLLVGAARPGALRIAVLGLLAIACGHSIVHDREIDLLDTPVEVSRRLYMLNPFPESLEIARYIREHSAPEDTIGIVGSEPQICAYAGRRSASGYVYMYPLVEDQPYADAMQKEFVAEMKAALPKFIVFVEVSASWLVRTEQPNQLYSEIQGMCNERYEGVGVIDIEMSGSKVLWEGAAKGYAMKSHCFVLVYRRKDGS